MARRMSRKLVDVKTLEELAVIQEALNRRKVTNCYELYGDRQRGGIGMARVMVPLGELQAARDVLASMQEVKL